MSLGPMGMAGSVAGTHLPQSRGTETDRAQQDGAVQQRQNAGEKNAESASGVGETSEEQESSERDADGRRMWEKPPEVEHHEEEEAAPDELRSRDPSGDAGANLDLSG